MLRLALLFAIACTPPAEDGPVDDGYGSCPTAERVGSFFVEPQDTYTAVQGTIADGVAPYLIFDELLSEGDCVFVHPPALFCDPACASGTTCAADGTCVASPSNLDIGEVRISGLTADVSMTATPPTQTYFFRGDLPHPAYDIGDRLVLSTDDDGLSMLAYGIEDISVLTEAMPMERGQDSTLRWTAPTADVDTRVTVGVDIANHGGIPARIVCETADDGELVIGQALVDALLDVGHSGFPTVTLARRSSDTAQTSDGCVEFAVRSTHVLDVQIPGLISCSGPEDCPDGQTCQSDLTCG